MRIKFYYDIERFRLRKAGKVKRIAEKLISDFKYRLGAVDIIFTTDEKILEINREFLGHDYYTDIITFNYNEGKFIRGEIYISIDRVRENAIKEGCSLRREALRVIFHGLLHLCGFDDKSEKEISLMREKEDIYLVLEETE